MGNKTSVKEAPPSDPNTIPAFQGKNSFINLLEFCATEMEDSKCPLNRLN